MGKDFDNWHQLKAKLDSRLNSPDFSVRDIWWTHLGINIGDEQNGKGDKFLRPVLVYKKFNRRIFFAVPLSSKVRESQHHCIIHFHDKLQSALITQMCLVDSKRLFKKMGKLSDSQYAEITKAIIKIVS